MSKKYNINVDEELDKIDFKTLKDSLQSVDDILREFPQAAVGMYNRHMTDQERRSGAYASASISGNVNFNTNTFKDPARVERTYQNDVRNHWHPDGTTVRDIIAHEMGHQLERIILERAVNYNSFDFQSRIDRSVGWNKGTQATRIISEAAKAAKRTPEGKGLKIADLIRDVSRYATKNRSEALAECVADYHANGANAKPLSREVWKILKRELG